MEQIQITPAWTPMRYHPTQSALWRTPARFVNLPSGRGSGKTEIAKRRLAMYTAIDRNLTGERPPEARGLKHLYAYLGPTRQWAKRVAWDHLKALVPSHWWSKSPSESDLIIYTVFGSELHVIGMDKPARFEGDQWDGVVEDEASDQKFNIHLSIRPAITFKKGWWWKIGIPKRYGSGAPDYRKQCLAGKAHMEDYRRCIAAGATMPHPELATYSWPSWDIIPEEEVEDMRRRMDPKDFNEQVGGQWEQAGGAAFYQFDKSVHAARSIVPDHRRPMFVSCDFNVSPMSWIVAQLTEDGTGLQVIDEIWIKDTNTPACLNILWDRYGAAQRGGWHFYGDAAASQRHTSATLSDYAHIANDTRFKATCTFPRANPARKDRLASCNALLRNAADEVRCWIDPKCEMLINDLENRGLESDGNPVDPKDSDGLIGHISDAFGYIIHERWPSTVLAVEEGAGTNIGIFPED